MSILAKQFQAICIVNSRGEEVTSLSNISRICGISYLSPNHANSIQLTAGAAAWDVDGTAEIIIAANAIESDFYIDFVDVSEISEAAEIQIDLFADSVLIGSISLVRASTGTQEGRFPIVTKKQAAGAAITAKVSSSTINATTVNIKIGYSIP
jgi:hypothetical protein